MDTSNSITKISLFEPIHCLFEKHANQNPNATAIYFKTDKVSYEQLNKQANQLAHYLCNLGVGSEVLVGVCMDRSVHMIVSLLAILKAGGAYLPLDPNLPQERLNFILEDSKIPLLLTDNTNSYVFEQLDMKTINIIKDWELISSQCTENCLKKITAESLIYTIYTSGSTGKPKGVQINHSAFLNFLTSMQQQPGMSSNDCCLALTTLSFDIAGLEIFLPLITGASLLLASSEETSDIDRIINIIDTLSVTVMQATPATYRMLIDAGWKGNSSLKILCGGEALPASLANILVEKCKELWNMYGPTETTVWSTISKVESGVKTISLGFPINNTDVYILDENLNCVNNGEIGELYIGGDGLARGYLNQPELTKERFIIHSIDSITQKRIYKTGDLVRRSSDSLIEYIGRSDFQVKVRGYRIELGEIESNLELHNNIRQAIAITQEDEIGEKNIVAYMIANSDIHPTVHELREFLSKSLPDYMIPSHFVFVDKFPLTPNEKIDRKALALLKPQHVEDCSNFVAASSPMEKEVAQIWCKFLSIDNISIYDNFLDLGGHSLMANRLRLRINEIFNVKLSLIEILTDGLTISGMVALIENKLIQQSSDEDIEAMLEQLEGLSDEEIQKLLEDV